MFLNVKKCNNKKNKKKGKDKYFWLHSSPAYAFGLYILEALNLMTCQIVAPIRGVWGLEDLYRSTHIKGFWKISVEYRYQYLEHPYISASAAGPNPRDCSDIAIAISQEALAKRAVGRLLVHFRSF